MIMSVPTLDSPAHETNVQMVYERTGGFSSQAIEMSKKVNALYSSATVSNYITKRMAEHLLDMLINHAVTRADLTSDVELCEKADRDAKRFISHIPSDIASQILEYSRNGIFDDAIYMGIEPEGSLGIEFEGKYGDFIGSFYGDGNIVYVASLEDGRMLSGTVDVDDEKKIQNVFEAIRDVIFGEELEA